MNARILCLDYWLKWKAKFGELMDRHRDETSSINASDDDMTEHIKNWKISCIAQMLPLFILYEYVMYNIVQYRTSVASI